VLLREDEEEEGCELSESGDSPAVADRHLSDKLTFSAGKPPPPRMISQEPLMGAEVSAKYFS